MDEYRTCLTCAHRARLNQDRLTMVWWLHEAMIARIAYLQSPKIAAAIDRLITEA